jgi:hypothetical protein
MANLTDKQRAALRILGNSFRGQSLSRMLVRGFSVEMLQGLVRAGFATTRRDVIGSGNTKVAHLRITKAGRKAIAE